jgi:hypothetical protein
VRRREHRVNSFQSHPPSNSSPRISHKIPTPTVTHRTFADYAQIGASMSSQRKINSARANGAKSHGPKTEAGRKASSMNAVTHGLHSKGVILPNESREQYQEMLDAYIRQFHPEGPAEFDLIEEMVAAKWRQRRLWTIETDLLEDEMLTQTEELDKKYALRPLPSAHLFLCRPRKIRFPAIPDPPRIPPGTRLPPQSQNSPGAPAPPQNHPQTKYSGTNRIPNPNAPNFPTSTTNLDDSPTRNQKPETRNKTSEDEPPARPHASLDVTSPNSLA